MAAGSGCADIVTTLLEAGAEPALVKTGGFSPLWNAVTQCGHLGSRCDFNGTNSDFLFYRILICYQDNPDLLSGILIFY